MKKATVVVHQNYINDVIKNLHENGVMEIIDISKAEEGPIENFEFLQMQDDAETCMTYELRLSRLIGILKKIKPKKSGIKAIFNPDLPEIKTVEDRGLDEMNSYAEGLLEEIEKKILNYDKKLQEYNERIEKINNDTTQLNFIKDFDFDISDIGESELILVKVGLTDDIESLKKEINALDKSTIYSNQIGSGKDVQWAVLVAAHISKKDEFLKICREKITELDFEVESGIPKDLLKSLSQEKKDIAKEKKKIISELRVYAKEQLDDLLALKEEIRFERVRKEVAKNFGKTNSTYTINGWILEKDKESFRKSLEGVSKDHVICNFETPSANPDNPPVHLKTPGWAKPFRMFLDLFATPRYNEIDPMIFMGIFFILFFGIMLGDAGYGLLLLILSIFGYFKFSKISDTIKEWSFMGIWLAIVTIIVGTLTNSFFGDLIPRFFFNNPNQLLYTFTIAGTQFPIEPLRDPLVILTMSLLFGLIHLNIGIILAIYQSYKRKDYSSLFVQHFSWIPLQLGGGLLIGELLLKMWVLETIMLYIAAILVIIGFLLRMKHAGPLGFFDITGYIGDWLSYARLLALGLGTTGMALAFNIVAQIIPQMIPVVGIVFTPIILIFAHTANLGLQTLGAGVHSLRLQYVEFFNRFYEGGGKKFEPFSIERKFTKIEETK
ncbi:MAG: V-type ATP synthase subunit I [Thermoplasmatales archaeon]|nr:MAG: V-type ATP synthase subunit I [Thermoplasmatales archaeon]